MDGMNRNHAIAIRAVGAGDAGAVRALTAQLGYERSVLEIQRWIEELGAAGVRQTAMVACLDDEVVGWIEVSVERRLQSAPFALIGGLVVRDGLRSRGVGRRLCEAAENWCRAQDLETVRVTSRSTRTSAHRFYLRDGYETVKTSIMFEKKLR